MTEEKSPTPGTGGCWVPPEIWNNSQLKLTEKVTLTLLLEHELSLFEVAKQANLSQQTIKRHIEKYERLGLYDHSPECERCGTGQRIHQHHIVPQCFGGPDAAENLAYLCKPCHKKLHEKYTRKQQELYQEFVEGDKK